MAATQTGCRFYVTDECFPSRQHVTGVGREPPGGIHRWCEWKRVGNQGVTRSESETMQSTKGGGYPDRAARVRSDCEWNHPGSDQRGGTAARSATQPVGKLRMRTIAVVRIFAGESGGEFDQLRFPSATRAQPVDTSGDLAVAGRSGADLIKIFCYLFCWQC